MYCNYCAKLAEGNALFCCDEHKEKFAEAKKNKTAVPLQIKPGLVVNSKAYDKIPAIIAKYLGNSEDLSGGTKALTRYSTPKGIKRKNSPEEAQF